MKPKRIILIRHGESEGNIDRSIYARLPDYRLKLTSEGERQAREAGTLLQGLVKDDSCRFYISPFHRTRRTAELLKDSLPQNRIESLEDPRIREQEWGHYRSVTDSAIVDQDRDDYGPFFYRIPEGESGADVYDRLSDFIGSLFRHFEKDHFPENCIIVTHAMTMRVFLMRWLNWTVEQFENVRKPGNCEMYILEQGLKGDYELTSTLTLRNDVDIPTRDKEKNLANHIVKK